MRELIYQAAYKLRALIVCFNLPFDLSRFATGWTETRADDPPTPGVELRGRVHAALLRARRQANRYRPEL